MKALKVLVVLMGLLILAGLAVVAITVAKRSAAPADGARPATVMPAPPLAGAPAPGFGETTVPVPDGFAVAETRIEGDRLIVRLQAPDGRARVVLLDLASGRVVGTVMLRPEGAAPAPSR